MWVVLLYGKAGYSQRPSLDCPWCSARQKSSAVQWPMPLALGVRLLLNTVPKGVARPRPPAYGVPPRAVWQVWQLPRMAR
jgi:DNA-binding helix-hairpin-helix protein with protein kinase domain